MENFILQLQKFFCNNNTQTAKDYIYITTCNYNRFFEMYNEVQVIYFAMKRKFCLFCSNVKSISSKNNCYDSMCDNLYSTKQKKWLKLNSYLCKLALRNSKTAIKVKSHNLGHRFMLPLFAAIL